MNLFSILGLIISLGSIACWIITLIKMFKGNIGLAILGIICPLWAFIWGWMNCGTADKKLMLIWTACIVLAGFFNVMGGMGSASNL